MKLKVLWKTFNVKLIESRYTYWDTPYFWLEDTDNNELFDDITVNIPWESKIKKIHINKDFENLFNVKVDMINFIREIIGMNWYKIEKRWIDWNWYTFIQLQ